MRKNRLLSWIAFRYFFSRELPGVVHLLTWLSVISIAIGIAVLLIVLSVFNGFGELISDMFRAGDPPLKIVKREGKYFEGDSLLHQLRRMPNVYAVAPIVEEKGILEHGGYRYPVQVIAVDSSYFQVVEIDSSIVAGDRKLFFRKGALLGAGVALATKSRIHDPDAPVLLYLIDATNNVLLNPEKSIRQTYLIPTGIVSIQKQIDDQTIWIPLTELYRLLPKRKKQITAIGLRINPEEDLEAIKSYIQDLIGNEYVVMDIQEQHIDFYKVLKTEKLVSYIIIFFLLVLISFNFLGVLFMIGLLKQKELGILSVLGLEEKEVKRIVYFLAGYSSFCSLILGLGIGGLFVWIQHQYGVLKFQTSEFLIVDYFPVAFQWSDIVSMTLSISILYLFTAWIAIKKLFPLSLDLVLRSYK